MKTVREELIRDLKPLGPVRTKENLSVHASLQLVAALLLNYGWHLTRPPKSKPRKVHAWCKYGHSWLRFERFSCWDFMEARVDMFYDGNNVKFVEVDS